MGPGDGVTADEVRRGFERGEFCAHFQPIVALATGQLVACEVLARWQHPERGLLRPGAFLPAIVSGGLELPFAWQILSAVCAQVVAWGRLPGTRMVPVTVNVDHRQFAQTDFVARWLATVAAAGLPASAIRLEAPREALALPLAPERVAVLRAAGVGVLFDDARPEDLDLLRVHLANLVAVKLDHDLSGDFVVDAPGHARWRPLVALARAQSLAVVAEAIEIEEQRLGALALGCDQGQGFLYGPPVAGEALVAWLVEQS